MTVAPPERSWVPAASGVPPIDPGGLPAKERNFTTRCGLWQSVHSAWRLPGVPAPSFARGSRKSLPQALVGPEQSTKPPSMKLAEMSCTSVPAAWSAERIGMRRASWKSVRMSGTVVTGALALCAAVVWHW